LCILTSAYSTYVFVLALLGEILGGILAGLLVWGAVKKRRNFLLPWLIFAVMVMVGTVVCIITCVVILPISYGITFLIIGVLELCEYTEFSSITVNIDKNSIIIIFLLFQWL
jgi:hypothetical protein